MEIQENTTYTRGAEEAPEDFLRQLAAYCEHRLHGIGVALALSDGRRVVGIIDRADPEVGVTLTDPTDAVVGSFAAAEIVAFRLIPEASPDRSDELRPN